MRKYPKFLRTMPEVLGISFPEIGIILVSLYLCLMFNVGAQYAIVFSIAGILVSKFLRKNFDFVGFLLPRNKQIFISENTKE